MNGTKVQNPRNKLDEFTPIRSYIIKITDLHKYRYGTVWLEILAGNLSWQMSGQSAKLKSAKYSAHGDLMT